MKKTAFILASVALAGTSAVTLAKGGIDREAGMMPQGPVTLAQVEAQVREHFAKVDANKDGFIDATERDAARTKMRQERRRARFQAMDRNKDGSISRDEFDAPQNMAAGGKRAHRGMGGRGRMDGAHLGQGGAKRDANGDQRISLEEALAGPVARFKAADANGDGTVTVEERQAARQKMMDERRGKRSL